MDKNKEDLRELISSFLHQNKEDIPEIPDNLNKILLDTIKKALQYKKQMERNAEYFAFYRYAMDAMPNPIFLKNEELKFMFFNQAYRDFFGLEKNENIGKTVLDLDYLPMFERERYQQEDSKIVADQSVFQYETVFCPPKQKAIDAMYWSKGFEIPGTGVKGIVGEIVNISAEKKALRDLDLSLNALETVLNDTKIEAETDPATGLYNKRVFTTKIPMLVGEAHSTGAPICCVIIDVDKFKYINDTYGHLYGDEVLLELSKIFTSSFRKSDLVARYGGDEFVALLPGAKLVHAIECSERIREKVKNTVKMPGGESVTLSIGVAQLAPDDDPHSFIAKADDALYTSKKSGRDKVTADE